MSRSPTAACTKAGAHAPAFAIGAPAAAHFVAMSCRLLSSTTAALETPSV